MLVIVWHLLRADVVYTDLGADYYAQRDNPQARKARLLRQLEELGYAVDIRPAC